MIAELNPFVSQLLQSALVVLIPMVLVFLGAFGVLLWQQLRAFLKTRVSERTFLLIDAFGSMCVRAAEQTISLVTPEAKKQFATDMLDQLLAQFKIDMDPDLKGKLLEGVLAKEKIVFGLDYIRNAPQAIQIAASQPAPTASTAGFLPANGGAIQ